MEVLTERQKEILRLSLLPYKLVAKRLHIERTTVATHMNNIFGILAVSNAGAAVIEAVRRGEINIDEVETV